MILYLTNSSLSVLGKKITVYDNKKVCRAIKKENPGGKGDSFMTLAFTLFAVTHFVHSVSYW